MSLDDYIKKRDFSKTSEPKAGKSNREKLVFVIQKHAASHLHYDFRLEMKGVLKSWAVPKGPSTDPDIKRLAMMVEDHPFDYRTFEGIIPKGEYGGGTVIVWDEGTYEPLDPSGKTKEALEKQLLHDLYTGKLTFTLKGKKLKGNYSLVKTRGRGENSWLLMKLQDKHASQTDVTLKDKSVVSGKTLEAVAKTSTNIYGTSKKSKEQASKGAIKKEAASKTLLKAKEDASREVAGIIKRAPKSALPAEVHPMLATLVDKPFDDDAWQYEVKWDGYRAIASVHKGKVELTSRNVKSFNESFYPIYQALQKWEINAVVDGEIIVMNAEGQSDFQRLQNWRSEADGDLAFYVFDMLWLNGKNLMDLPLIDRRKVLTHIVPADDPSIRLSPVFEASGIDFFNAADQMGLEGIIAKRKDSEYLPDSRSKSWVKIKTIKSQEIVICGYTLNEDSSKKFSALIMGIYDQGALSYAGLVGTGFPDAMQTSLLKAFKPHIIKTSPFPEEPDYNKPSRFRPNPPKAKATWLKPVLVAEVNYREMTAEGIMRHASFKGLRPDKKPNQAVRELPVQAGHLDEEQEHVLVKNNMLQKPEKGGRKTLLNPSDETQVRRINGHELKFTNLSKIYWPKEKITKRDMLNYYYRVAPFILPHLKDRPQSLNRFPDGILGERFYQKNMKGKAPDWVEVMPYESEGETKELMVATDEASLLYMASLGCIEMNPYFGKVQSFDNPDYCVIDLDPDKNTFDQVIEAANVTRQVLDTLGVPSYCKTSGSTGMHIYIPLNAKYTYDQSQMFAKLVATLVHQEIPSFTSLERMVKNRKGKMYIDYLQNRPGATIAGVYSLRPKPGATVSMPLHWEEVKKGLKMSDFNMHNAIARLEDVGDLFKPVLGKGIDMTKALKKAEGLRNS